MKRFSRTDWIVFALVWVGFYLLDRLTFYCRDDMIYSFIEYPDNSLERITSFAQIWWMQCHDYLFHSGRFIVHVLVQCFVNLWGFTAFEIVNSFVFVAFYAGMLKLVRRHLSQTPCDHLILILLLASVNEVGTFFLGIVAFVVNYLWPACAMVWFLIMLDKARRPGWLIGLAALIIGSLQESFSLPISGALFVYYCFHFKQLRGAKLWAVLGFWIGTLIVFLAPGNFVRLAETVDVENQTVQKFSVGISILRAIYGQFMLSLPLMALLLSLFLQFCFDRRAFRNFLREYQILLYIIGFSIFLGCLMSSGARQLTCPDVAAIIMLMRLIYHYLGALLTRWRVAVDIALFAIVAVGYVFIYKDRARMEQLFADFYVAPTTEGVIVAPEFLEEGLAQVGNPFSMNFIASEIFEPLAGDTHYMTKLREEDLGREPISAVLPMSPAQLAASYKGGTMRLGDYGYVIASENPKARIYMHSTPRTAVARLMLRILRPGEEKIDDVTPKCHKVTVDGTTYFVYYNTFREISGLSVKE